MDDDILYCHNRFSPFNSFYGTQSISMDVFFFLEDVEAVGRGLLSVVTRWYILNPGLLYYRFSILELTACDVSGFFCFVDRHDE